MPAVDLGCGTRRAAGAIGLDRHRTPAVDVVADVLALPFRSGSIDALTAHQVVEHLPPNGHAGRDPFFAFFDECHRVLRPGGILKVDVPHVRGSAAFGDPTHRRFFTEETFSHLWDAGRDPGYARRLWELVSLRSTPWYDTRRHLDRRHPVLDALLRRWTELAGPPGMIYLAVRKP